MVEIKLQVKTDLTQKMIRKLEKTPEAMTEATTTYANVLKDSLKKHYLMGARRRGASPRTKSAQLFKVTPQKENVRVQIPRRSFLLDSMTPHYVSLKRGRMISRWAKRYFGGKTISGKSRVYKGPRGGLKGAIYVTPDPFIRKGVSAGRQRLQLSVKRNLERNFRK